MVLSSHKVRLDRMWNSDQLPMARCVGNRGQAATRIWIVESMMSRSSSVSLDSEHAHLSCRQGNKLPPVMFTQTDNLSQSAWVAAEIRAAAHSCIAVFSRLGVARKFLSSKMWTVCMHALPVGQAKLVTRAGRPATTCERLWHFKSDGGKGLTGCAYQASTHPACHTQPITGPKVDGLYLKTCMFAWCRHSAGSMCELL